MPGFTETPTSLTRAALQRETPARTNEARTDMRRAG